MRQTEIEATERHKQLTKLIHITQTGQILGFIVAICGLGASVMLAWLGAQTAASIVGGATVISLVSAFVLGQKQSNN